MATKEKPKDANEVCREMAQVRCELTDDFEGVVENAKRLADWRYYIRKYPYACVGAAMAVGFLVVPQKLSVMSPSAAEMAKLAKHDRLVVKPSATAGPPTPSWKKKVITFAANALLRSAIAYFGQQAGKMAGHQAAEAETTASA